MKLREHSKKITMSRNEKIFKLVFIDHKTVKAVAATYGLSVPTVYTILRKYNKT